MIDKFEPVDIMAMLLIGGCFAMMWAGKDGVVTSVLMMVAGFYFGRKSRPK